MIFVFRENPHLKGSEVNTDGHWANPGARMSEGLEREMLRECKDLQRTERSSPTLPFPPTHGPHTPPSFFFSAKCNFFEY